MSKRYNPFLLFSIYELRYFVTFHSKPKEWGDGGEGGAVQVSGSGGMLWNKRPGVADMFIRRRGELGEWWGALLEPP